jgi:hypothetical protein
MQDLYYLKEPEAQTRWASFENPLGEKGGGGKTNLGAKGRACQPVEPGQTWTLMETTGSGTVDQIWMTLDILNNPEGRAALLRSLRIDIFWDGAEKPAVSCPVGDFFGANLGKPVPLESAFLVSPDARSFNSFFKMPFLKGAKITLTNESDTRIAMCFYNVLYTLKPMPKNDILYFHAFFNRENKTKLGRDYTILPKISGEGKIIGVNFGIQSDPIYEDSWFGEGEVKIYLDGDDKYPTLCGTGLEDYPNNAWGLSKSVNQGQGCLIADKETGVHSFYRFHLHDRVLFHKEVRMTIQSLGCADKKTLLKVSDNGAPLKVVSGSGGPVDRWSEMYMEMEKEFVFDRNSKEGWYCFYREDDYSSTVYFYLDKPVSTLPSLMPLEQRTADLRP